MKITKEEINNKFLYYFYPWLPIMCWVWKIDDKYYLVPLKPNNVWDRWFDTFMKNAECNTTTRYNRYLWKEVPWFITCLSDIWEPYFQDEFMKSWYSWMYTHLVLKSKKRYIEFDDDVIPLEHYSKTVNITMWKEIKNIDDFWFQVWEDKHFSKERLEMASEERKYIMYRRR